jgi:hypothetical protein
MLCTGSPTHGHSERTRRRQTTDAPRNTRVRSLPSHARKTMPLPATVARVPSTVPSGCAALFFCGGERGHPLRPSRTQASLVVPLRWQRKSKDWRAIASLATTVPLHRWAASVRETGPDDGRQPL